MYCRVPCFVLLMTAVAGCGKAPGPNSASVSGGATGQSSAAPVATIRPEKKTLRRFCTQPGQVDAFEEAPIYARVEGYVERLLVDIGDRVKGPRFDNGGKQTEAGQRLATLAAPELEDEVHQQEAALAQSGAQIEQATAAVRVSEAGVAVAQAKIREAESTVTRTDAEAERWRREHERIDELAKNKTVTPKLADETRQQWQAAEAARQESAARIESTRESPMREPPPTTPCSTSVWATSSCSARCRI